MRTSAAGRQTHKVDFFGANAWDKFGVSGEGTFFGTNGYFTVPEMEGGSPSAGLIDAKATLDYQNANLKIDFSPTDRISGFVRGGYFSEDRINAKGPTTTGLIVPSELNNTIWKSVSAGVLIRMPDDSDLQARAWGNFETFHSNNHGLTAAPSRNGSRLTLYAARADQRHGRNGAVVEGHWARETSSLSAQTGAGSMATAVEQVHEWDVDRRRDESNFRRHADQHGCLRAGPYFRHRSIPADTQRHASTTGKTTTRTIFKPSRRPVRPCRRNRPSCNVDSTVPCLADKKNTVGNPGVGALYHLTDSVSVWSSISWGFRAPTLNELYRQFAVGQVNTLANDQLGPERMTSGEGGVTYSPARNLTWRSSWFVNKFTNPVSNVTINVVPERRRRGSGKIWERHVSGGFKAKSSTVSRTIGAFRLLICMTSQR